eukprot:11304654-Alexandrium_andersonii.AAC.1
MSASLVGSEMCIRDSVAHRPGPSRRGAALDERRRAGASIRRGPRRRRPCLLYTSDAADDM